MTTDTGVHLFCCHDGKGDAAETLDTTTLGHKGAQLIRMRRLGLPVPPGFVLDAQVCARIAAEASLPEDVRASILAALEVLQEETGQGFGDGRQPLLVALRAGLPRPMPGLLPTVLNIGLSPEIIEQAVKHGQDAAFLWDCYRRFLRDFGVHAGGMAFEDFEHLLEDHKESLGLVDDTMLEAGHWQEIAQRHAAFIHEEAALEIPAEPLEQLFSMLVAMMRAWDSPSMRRARTVHQLPDGWRPAIVVQAMVFGNRNERSGAGVIISRDPLTGRKPPSGEWLGQAQGEDIVAGLRTPWPISEDERRLSGLDVPSLETALPQAHAALLETADVLERHFRRVQNIEFCIDDGQLWLLQTFDARLGTEAALQAAVDMVREGIKSRRQAICDIDPQRLEKLLHPVLERSGGASRLLARGLGASPGAASGEVVTDAEEAMRLAAAGRSVILVRPETTPEDIPAMHQVRGVLTARGGMTSHAAVIARGLGIPCVAGVGTMEIEAGAGRLRIGKAEVRANEWITIDGASGEVFRGRMPTRQPQLPESFHTLLQWADELRRIAVRANADTPRDAEAALAFGAEGIGLCRSEHMFFGSERLELLQELILAESDAQRQRVLAQLVQTHGEDFLQLFAVMAGKPVCVRLLDPPVHEFLPRSAVELEPLAGKLGTTVEHLQARVDSLREYNPMLGHRGVRLIITLPGLLQMQVRAMLQAMHTLALRRQAPSRLEIMVPFIMSASEMARMRQQILDIAQTLQNELGQLPPFHIGCMIELPSACLKADEIARHADFLSFGTNDLTQTVLGLSRDDSGRFLHAYLREGLLEDDPFVTLERQSVLPFIGMATERGRTGNEAVEIGACGEQAGEPRSIRLLAAAGLDYISCSPFRLPIARLAAAQATACENEDQAIDSDME